jgi:hypothetical protein
VSNEQRINDKLKPLTVGDIKRMIAEIPDDMPVFGRDGHSGEQDNVSIYVEDDADCHDRPTLEIVLG